MRQPLYGVHGLTLVDDETTEWLLSTWPKIWCGLAVHKNCSNDEEE